MFFEVKKVHGKGYKHLPTMNGEDSRKVAGQAGSLYGSGRYKVRPEGSLDKWLGYKVTPLKTM